MLKGFPPIIGEEPNIMILGSMPSVVSLDKQEYYGFSYNRFWKIMNRVYDMPISTYEEKVRIIMKHHIVLWDVIGSCEREGSLDSAIHHVEVNDIESILIKYSSIHRIICNGKKSYDLFQKYFSHIPVTCEYLPSTSNANRSIKEELLFQKWIDALQ